jgi:uncharacterized protein YecE (DUF72 family)
MQPAAAEDAPGEAKAYPSSDMKVLDAVVVRPVTFVNSVFSAGTFVLALPFAAFDPALEVYCYFDNDEAGYAVSNALTLRDMLDGRA